MADDTWKKLKEKVKAKRTKKRGVRDTSLREIKGKELVVQRLSAEVSGKAQKYSRIGPREFVPFDDELTLDNIKQACEKHFIARTGKSCVCDILAGEQGPSCKTIEQIPDVRIIYVRFITRYSLVVEELDNDNPTNETKIKQESNPQTSIASDRSPLKRPYPAGQVQREFFHAVCQCQI